MNASMTFEVLDKSLEDDCDSEDNEWDDDAPSNQISAQEAFAGLTIGKSASEKSPARALDENGGADEFDDDYTDDEDISRRLEMIFLRTAMPGEEGHSMVSHNPCSC